MPASVHLELPAIQREEHQGCVYMVITVCDEMSKMAAFWRDLVNSLELPQ
jgi:hypothetical protein